jgi:propanol-preferring alcohol dehydrogenase
MRAWVLEKQAAIEERPLKLVEVPTPVPQDDEVRIKILVSGVLSTRSPKNIESARREGANWVGDASQEHMPYKLDSAIIFPPAGNLVEPVLSQLEKGGTLVMAPVSASPIKIQDYSQNLWGHSMQTLFHLKRSDAEEFLDLVNRLELKIGTSPVPFEEAQDALISAKHGELEQPNAVIEITDASDLQLRGY